MKNKTNLVGLIEDEVIFREHMAKLLKKSKYVKEVTTYNSAEDFWGDIDRKKYDILFIDINLPGISGIDLTRMISQKYPRIKIVIITVISSENIIIQALKAGAKSYIEKSEAPPVDFIIDTITSKGAVISPTIAAKVLNSFQNISSREDVDALSTREMQILEVLSSGESIKKIAERLHISEKTLRNHIHNIYKKLHINSRAEMMIKATEMGFL
ncbi:MAG: response regulator transcription factor [Spirochaetia bacterium]|nr:response regulator transcription factor [Spirochaetia bacterium]